MITIFKIYEEYTFKYEDNKETILNSITTHIQDIVPINKNEGFYYCLFEDGNSFDVEYGEQMDFSDIIIHFYFLTNTEEDVFDILEDFTEKEGLEYLGEKYIDNFIEISYQVPEKKVKEYYEIYKNTEKYNI